MTFDDLLAREAIRATLARCAQAGDSLRGEDYSACFTENGILQTENAQGEVNMRHEGRAAILAWQDAWKNAPPTGDGARKVSFVRHNLTTCQITLTRPDSAKARTYFNVWADNGPDHCGVYTDEFRRVGDEWLLSYRRVRTEWNADASLFVARD